MTAILFCLGLEVYTYYSAPICNTELSSEQNSEEDIVCSSDDSFEDDHSNQISKSFYSLEQKVLMIFPGDSSLLNEFSVSSWQPPKSS